MNDVLNGLAYIKQSDLQQFIEFANSLRLPFARPMPEQVWHYTSFEGLRGILESGSLYATQISCLNDNKEQRVLGDLIQEKIVSRGSSDSDPTTLPLWQYAIQSLANRNLSNAHYFVACFSESEDDLSQ